VRRQAREFEAALISQGIVRPNSARVYRKAIEALAKQAQRHLGRPLHDLAELYDQETLAALVVNDDPLDRATVRLSRYTLRQRRVALGAYLRAVGLPGLTFSQGLELLRSAFRRASIRRGYRFVILVGRPEQRDRYCPPLEDVRQFLEACRMSGHPFAGPRLAAAATLMLLHGLRPVSVLAIQGSDLRWHGEDLFLTVKEKASRGKRERREIQLRPQAAVHLMRYIHAFNSWASSTGRPYHIGVGLKGPVFRSEDGRPWRYDDLRTAFLRYCQRAGIVPFTPYGLRRVFASGLSEVLSVEEAAVAGGWLNPKVYLQHYARSLGSWQPPLVGGEPPVDLDDDLPSVRTPREAGREVTALE
jgi:integrase